MDSGDKLFVCILTLMTIGYIASEWIEKSHDAEVMQLRLAVQMYQSQLEGK